MRREYQRRIQKLEERTPLADAPRMYAAEVPGRVPGAVRYIIDGVRVDADEFQRRVALGGVFKRYIGFDIDDV